MDQNLQNRRYPSSDSNRVKQLVLEAEASQLPGVEYAPFFYAEVRIDFNDVRTGFRTTVSLNKAIEIRLIAPDLLWAEDMLRDIDPGRTKPLVPEAAFAGSLPGFVGASFLSRMETQFIQYLLRTYKAKVFRNFELDAYSGSGESLQDFISRCADLLDESKRVELDALHELFNRKLEQIKQRYLNSTVSDNLELAKAESQDRDLFWCYSERIAGLFLQAEAEPGAIAGGVIASGSNSDLAERLTSLEFEARQTIADIRDSYRQRARSVDEYLLHPNLKDIHFARCCILWIPAGAA